MPAMHHAFSPRNLISQAFTRNGCFLRQSSSVVACRLRQRLPVSPPTARSRGVKSEATVRLDDLFNDVQKPEGSLPELQDGPSYPTVVQQARDNMDKHENCVLLTRVGSFYEVYPWCGAQCQILTRIPALFRPSRQIRSTSQPQNRPKKDGGWSCFYGRLSFLSA